MRRVGKHHIPAKAALGLLILLMAWSGYAWADPQEQPPKTPDPSTSADQAAPAPKSSRHMVGDSTGFKGFALSLDRSGDDQSLHLKTTVLVKPLKTDHFFVAFAASAPLIKYNGGYADGFYGTDPSLVLNQDARPIHIAQGPHTGSDWIVITDWPKAHRLLPDKREINIGWVPGMNDTAGWLSRMELIFLPADQWTVKAILSMAQDPHGDRISLSSPDAHSARIGMAVDVDYQILKSIALGFDYGHYRYGRTFSVFTGDAGVSPNPSNSDGPIRSDTFTARLTIRF